MLNNERLSTVREMKKTLLEVAHEAANDLYEVGSLVLWNYANIKLCVFSPRVI